MSVNASPWWYRERGMLIGAIFGVGFLAGNVRFDGHAALPAAVVWGRHFGNAGVELFLWGGIELVLFAWLLRTCGTAYLRGEVVFAPDVQHDRLIVDGPFKYVRNPLYIGNVLLALGVGLYAPPLGFAIVVLGNAIFVALLAREEERHLAAQYGADYAAYCKKVRAFLPRLIPAEFPSAGHIEPDFRSAFRAEVFSFFIAIALVPLALYGPEGLSATECIMAVAVVLFVAATRKGRRA
jgi:protein-S-isoprenylcysteine O-methyltransferase Ste14